MYQTYGIGFLASERRDTLSEDRNSQGAGVGSGGLLGWSGLFASVSDTDSIGKFRKYHLTIARVTGVGILSSYSSSYTSFTLALRALWHNRFFTVCRLGSISPLLVDSHTTILSILPRAFLLLDSHLIGAGFAMSQVAQVALISLDDLQNNWMTLQGE
ncbi:hypothetical protein ARMSODRAFT_516545 [Armillaria solidipes]|uniref:Uncharacterized protein n=1 Tax=Armillaria solidipes TaxID=1076256 RepID=A0A2H3AZE8_9AGAR|nr:hypothetical protein ARMSODRAFT_516545 [Armillaria solidipes]